MDNLNTVSTSTSAEVLERLNAIQSGLTTMNSQQSSINHRLVFLATGLIGVGMITFGDRLTRSKSDVVAFVGETLVSTGVGVALGSVAVVIIA